MNKDLDKLEKNIKGKIKYNYSIKNHTWLNIGGNAKIFFVPETLLELRDFLLCMKKENRNFFVIGAGSNLLVSENIQKRIFIKLGKNFNKISLTKDDIIIVRLGHRGMPNLPNSDTPADLPLFVREAFQILALDNET